MQALKCGLNMKVAEMRTVLWAGILLVSNHVAAETKTSAQTLAGFYDALAHGDVAAASAALADDVTIFESGYVERSKREYVGHHLIEDIEFAKATTRKLLHQSEKVTTNLAVIESETETTGTFQGKLIHLYCTETAVLANVDGRWTMQHIHWSSRKAKK